MKLIKAFVVAGLTLTTAGAVLGSTAAEAQYRQGYNHSEFGHSGYGRGFGRGYGRGGYGRGYGYGYGRRGYGGVGEGVGLGLAAGAVAGAVAGSAARGY